MQEQNRPSNDEWRKLLPTEEEWDERLRETHYVDDETGEVLGPKPRLSQVLCKMGIDWDRPSDMTVWDYANELFDVMEAERRHEREAEQDR